jgi:formylglycine-generating enzyme required for sulfatase activity
MTTLSRRELLAAASALVVCAGHDGSVAAAESAAPEGMILIPAGPFVMGTSADEAADMARRHEYHVSWFAGELPRREVRLPAYWIDKYPVTNAQFQAFCKATGYAPRAHWQGPEPPDDRRDHPVVSVNRGDCLAYATWAGKRLPSEAEWEKAARGERGLAYPWGSEFSPDACCWNRSRGRGSPLTDPVTAYPRGASPYGVMDMVGNAAEWCSDSPGPGSGIIKGGCWLTRDPLNLRPAARNMSGFDNNPLDFYGFRCAREAR